MPKKVTFFFPAFSKNFPVQELKGVTIERKIGSGNFGEVYLGKWEGSSVALKKLTIDQISEFERECEILW